jgi:hypothetical protein
VENLSRNPGGSSEVDLAADGATLHVVWEDGLTSGAEADEVVAVRSGDGGRSFSELVNVTGTAAQHDTDPDLAVDGPLMAVTYEIEIDKVNKDVVLQRSGDGGQTWGGPVNVSSDDQHSAEPAVAVAGATVHLAFENRGSESTDADDRLAYVRSPDGGATFDAPVVLPEGAERRPALSVSGEVVRIFGCSRSDPTRSQLYGYRSEDGGATFAAPVALTDTPSECHKPSVDAHGDLVVVAWEEQAPDEESGLHVISSRDGGRTFGAAVKVSRPSAEAEESSIAVDPLTGEVHLVWVEEPPEHDSETASNTGELHTIGWLPSPNRQPAHVR